MVDKRLEQRFTEKSMRKFVKELIREERETKNYLQTEDFQKQIGLIKKFPLVDQEDLTYFPGKYAKRGLTEENFQRVCNSVFLNFKDELKADTDYSCQVDYQGVRFSLITGQGSCYVARRL